MKILYAIQTTGNGHLARAQSIIPRLKEIANIDIITFVFLSILPNICLVCLAV